MTKPKTDEEKVAYAIGVVIAICMIFAIKVGLVYGVWNFLLADLTGWEDISILQSVAFLAAYMFVSAQAKT